MNTGRQKQICTSIQTKWMSLFMGLGAQVAALWDEFDFILMLEPDVITIRVKGNE